MANKEFELKNGQVLISEDLFKKEYAENSMSGRERNNLMVKEGAEGRFENLWNQAEKSMKDMGWDLSGRDKSINQYVRGVKSFVMHLANDTKITKLKNYKNSDVMEHENSLIESNYSVSTIKPYASGIQQFHKGLLEMGITKNKIQDAATIHDRCELPKRQNGTLARAWNDNEVDAMLDEAKKSGRMDVYYGIKTGDLFGIRIQTVGRLEYKQVKKALEDGYLRVKEKGGKWRNIPVEDEEQRQVLIELGEIAKSENLKVGNHIFRDSDFLNENKKTQGDNTHDKTVKSIQNFIADARQGIQDSDRKNIAEYADSKQKRIVEKTELTFHGLRYRYAQRQMDNLLKKGVPFNKACGMISKLLGHNRAQITRLYLCQKNANNQIQSVAA